MIFARRLAALLEKQCGRISAIELVVEPGAAFGALTLGEESQRFRRRLGDWVLSGSGR